MEFKSKLMTCLYCKGRCVKNGPYSKTKQRYQCKSKKCKRTFSDSTIEKFKTGKNKRFVLHLILAGCSNQGIAEELEMDEKIIIKWRKIYFRRLNELLPDKPSLTIPKLKVKYERMERSRITKFNHHRKGPTKKRK